MKCPTCGHRNLPGVDYCEECRTSLMQEDLPGARGETEMQRYLLEKVEVLGRPRECVTTGEDTPASEAIAIMGEADIGCLPVTDSDGVLTGTFSERDVLERIAGLGVDPSAVSVGDYMKRDPETVRRDHAMGVALHRMMVEGCRHLPLVDEDGKPTGMISSRDVLGFVAAEFERAGAE